MPKYSFLYNKNKKTQFNLSIIFLATLLFCIHRYYSVIPHLKTKLNIVSYEECYLSNTENSKSFLNYRNEDNLAIVNLETWDYEVIELTKYASNDSSASINDQITISFLVDRNNSITLVLQSNPAEYKATVKIKFKKSGKKFEVNHLCSSCIAKYNLENIRIPFVFIDIASKEVYTFDNISQAVSKKYEFDIKFQKNVTVIDINKIR